MEANERMNYVRIKIPSKYSKLYEVLERKVTNGGSA